MELLMTAGRSPREIGAWCEANGIDAWYGMNGDLAISTSLAYDEDAEALVRGYDRLGVRDLVRALSAEQVRGRFDSPVARGGVAVAHAAGVQPARLARGLRRLLIERGVRIHEQTPVARFGVRTATAQTPRGTVRARRAILGLNAWFKAFGGLRRAVRSRGSYIVISAPAPERLEAINWTGGQGVYDFRISVHYLRTTRDGRIAFGGGKHRVTPKSIDGRYRYDERSVRELVEDFRRWFPSFDGVPLEAAWGGPIDVGPTHHPFFGTLPGGVSHYGVGFTGGGVGPCHLGGKILAGLALGVEDEFTSLPLARGIVERFPPRPLGATTEGRRPARRPAHRCDRARPPAPRLQPGALRPSEGPSGSGHLAHARGAARQDPGSRDLSRRGLRWPTSSWPNT
jgi:glycine/D-amino acid oxidase-like deaminating enzyme